MGKVIGGMTISLDGFASDAEGGLSQLYPDLPELQNAEFMQEEVRSTGAVILGRKSYDMGDPDSFADSYEFQVPLFVLTHHVPEKHPKENENLKIVFIADGIESAISKAKAAAGDKDVMLIGASINQQAINLGLCDELHMGIMPVLLGGGLRLFDNIISSNVKLEKFKVFEAGQRTDIWFRILK